MSDPLPWFIDKAAAGAAQQAPAAARNRGPILAVLHELLPGTGSLLEVASGSGEHALWFSAALPGIAWLPSDAAPEACASIAAWRAAEGSPNLLPPVQLDVIAGPWPDGPFDALLCINMVHIAPWTASEALFAAAGRLLARGGLLILYGPFIRAGVETAPGNLAFDAALRGRDPLWGLRALEALDGLAGDAGLVQERVIEMPANNCTVAWRRPAIA